jgi:hypothetical protein
MVPLKEANVPMQLAAQGLVNFIIVQDAKVTI